MVPLVERSKHCSCCISIASQWEKGGEALLPRVTQGPSLTEALLSNDTARSKWGLRVCCSREGECGEGTPARSPLGPPWPNSSHLPQTNYSGVWEGFPHSRKKEPVLLSPRNLCRRLLGGPVGHTVPYTEPTWNSVHLGTNIVTWAFRLFEDDERQHKFKCYLLCEVVDKKKQL